LYSARVTGARVDVRKNKIERALARSFGVLTVLVGAVRGERRERTEKQKKSHGRERERETPSRVCEIENSSQRLRGAQIFLRAFSTRGK